MGPMSAYAVERCAFGPPEAAYGELYVLTDTPLQRAVSQRLTPERKYLPTFVDRSRGWVKVQDAPNPKSAVMIIPGVIFEIGNQGEFCALWLHPQSGIKRADAEHRKSNKRVGFKGRLG